MKLLLDTHSFLWFIEGNTTLSRKARALIESDENEKLVSMASVLEIAIKSSLGKLILSEPLDQIIPAQIYGNEFHLLPLPVADSIQLSRLPFHHRDPFDRMIIARSVVHGISVIGKDEVFDAYGIQRIW